MKKGLKFVLLFLFISCSRHNDTPTANCITRIYDTNTTSTVTTAQLNAILPLFQRNNIPTSGLQFIGIDSNIYMPPNYSYSVSQVEVVAYVFINGLPTFFGNFAYVFYNDVYQTNLTGHYGTPSSTDTSAHQTLEDLRNIYLAHYQQDEIEGGALNSVNTHPGLNWRDSCLTAMLGYADASVFDSTITYGTMEVKAWRVSPMGSFFGVIPYPSIYVEDSNGAWATSDIFLP